MNKFKQIMLMTVLLFCVHQWIVAQSINQNYILTKTYTSPTAHIDQIDYFDGLGRPVETVQKQFTPNGKDLVAIQTYDNFGRQDKIWLPAPNSKTDGTYNGSSTAATYYGDTYAYSQTSYESSPLNRVETQYGPGSDWRNNSRKVKTEYLTNSNTAALSCPYYYPETQYQFKKNNNYANGTLFVTKTTDEDNNVQYEFKDKLGRVVLQRQIDGNDKFDTNFIYDDRGNLVFVLPPIASDSLTDSNKLYEAFNSGSFSLMQNVYFYLYDARNRIQTRYVPGSGVEDFVYDRADRLAMCQISCVEDDAGRGWIFYKYDALGRMILSGIYKGDVGSNWGVNERAYYMIAKFKNENILSVESTSSTGAYNYTWTVFPSANLVEVTQVNYYDNYTFATNGNTQLNYQTKSGYGTQYASAKGLLTGTRNKLLDENAEIITAYYYDAFGNLVQKRSNNHLGGYDFEYYAYNYNNLVTKKYTEHTIAGQTAPLTEAYTYHYDNALRLLSVTYRLNDEPEATLSEYAYNESGQVSQKTTGNIETAAFTYNIRGWQQSQTGARFSENLYYTSNPKSGGATYYGGNIAAMMWQSQPNTATVRGYSFVYDNLSRLTGAAYGEGSGLNANTQRYDESFGYDKQGNPLTLQRYGLKDDNSFGLVDDLQMTQYLGNAVRKVVDSAGDQSGSDVMEFKDGYTQSDDGDYIYNSCGSLMADYNRNICMIKYNYLTLPQSVQFRYGHRIEYLYDAAGVRHRTRHREASHNLNYFPWDPNEPAESDILHTTVTDYVGNKIYKNGVLKVILTEEGYMEKENGMFNSYYYLKDHLGNNRIVMNSSGTVVQATNHYPSGTSIAEYPRRTDQGVQPYKFGGKELDRTHGLDFYDFEARAFDPTLMRFTTIDPMAEKYYAISPYAYCLNNPVKYVDPDGRVVRIANNYVGAIENIAKIAATNLGSQVMSHLIGQRGTYYLNSTFRTKSSGYNPSNGDINYVGNPWYSEIPGDGGALNSMIAMGHETFHAYESSYGIGRDEPGAVSFANYLRQSYSLSPLREQYTLGGRQIEGNFHQFGSNEKISDFTTLGNNADKTSSGFSYTKTTTIVESYKKGFLGIKIPDKTRTETATYYMTVSRDKNNNASFQIYNSEEEYKKATSNW